MAVVSSRVRSPTAPGSPSVIRELCVSGASTHNHHFNVNVFDFDSISSGRDRQPKHTRNSPRIAPTPAKASVAGEDSFITGRLSDVTGQCSGCMSAHVDASTLSATAAARAAAWASTVALGGGRFTAALFHIPFLCDTAGVLIGRHQAGKIMDGVELETALRSMAYFDPVHLHGEYVSGHGVTVELSTTYVFPVRHLSAYNQLAGEGGA